jgi:hypothetical protein
MLLPYVSFTSHTFQMYTAHVHSTIEELLGRESRSLGLETR